MCNKISKNQIFPKKGMKENLTILSIDLNQDEEEVIVEEDTPELEKCIAFNGYFIENSDNFLDFMEFYKELVNFLEFC